MPRKTGKIISFLAIITAITALYFVFRSQKANNDVIPKNITIPAFQNQPEIEKLSEPEDKEDDKAFLEPVEKETTAPEKYPAQDIPEKYSLDIPFYSQAPLSNWDAFHEDMCEEASILNAAYYLLDKRPSKEEYEKELQKMQRVEKKEIGEWKSTTVAQTQKLVDAYFGGNVKSKIIDDPTIRDIEAAIATEHPIIAPLAGREIGNPNFKPPGPIYHMLTIKGYDAQNFITNDVGTRKGNSYVYKKEVIMENIHDWNEKDIHLGEKRILVLYK